MKPQALSAVSPLVARKPPERVGAYAHQAIKTYTRHILKQEKGVLAHQDPEFLHQMRIGLRRLRTTQTALAPAIVLPKQVNERALKRLGRVLGRVRDLDVLQSWLAKFVDQVKLKKSERKVLRRLEKTLNKQRKKYLIRMDNYLHSQGYKRLVKSIKRWLKQPQYKSLACLPLRVALPDLQLPMIGQLLMHPGWLVVDDTNMTDLDQVHDLRKYIKGVRYQMGLFREFYGEGYKTQINNFKQLQDLLGELQDEVVLQTFLVKTLGATWAKKIPSLDRYLQTQHQQLWQQWLILRQPYFALNRRNALYQLFLQ